MTHTFAEQTIEFNLVYKKRKTMGIYINLYGQVEVRIPRETPEKMILELLEKKWDWIILKTTEQKERTAGHKEKVYVPGEVFLYLGNTYPIEISQDVNIKKDYVEFEIDKLHIYVKEQEDERIKQALNRFYHQQCKTLVEKRIQVYQKNFKVKPRSIRITDNKGTWGTCDSKQQLTFNWKLAMAPMESIDYVVVHEMSHLIHLNHDRSFWRLVGKILPDYENRKNWLSQSSWKMIV